MAEAMSDDARKRALKTLRTKRTVRRNKAREDLGSVEDLHTENPVFPADRRAEELVIIMTKHLDQIREFDREILQLLTETEVEADVEASEEFIVEIESGIAAIQAVIIQKSNHEERFMCFVAKRQEATPVERLMVLRKYVSGAPARIIHALELTDANYQVALDALKENYARTDNDKQRILSELRNLPRVLRYSDLPALRNLLTLLQTNIATLASNGIPLEEFALSLRSAIEAALPIRLRQEFKDARRLERRLHSLSSGSRESSIAGEQTETNPGNNISEDNGNGGSVSGEAASEVRKLIQFVRDRVRDWEDNLYLDDRAPGAVTETSEGQSNLRDFRRRPRSTVAYLAPGRNASAGPGYRPRSCLFCRSAEHNSSKCTADLTLAKRKEILEAQQRCVKCFRQRHANASQCRGPRVPCSRCSTRQHYSSMHPAAPVVPTPPHVRTDGGVSAVTGAFSDRTVGGVSADTGALLLTASAYVINGGVKIPIRVFVDPGSTLTVMLPSLRAMLRDAPVGINSLTIQTFSSTLATKEVPLYNMRIAHVKGGPPIELLAHEYEFNVDPQNTCSEAVMQTLAKFDRTRPLADRCYVGEWSRMQPAVLLGMNQINKIMTREAQEHVVDDILAYPSKLGWLVGGSIPLEQNHVKGKITSTQIVCCSSKLSNREVKPLTHAAKDLETLWSLEAIGINEPSSSPQLSADDEEALRQFNQGISYEDGRYSVSFPKRPSISQLPNNRLGAEQRLARKVSHLLRDPDKHRRYHSELMKFVEEGFAVEVRDSGCAHSSAVDGSYFMPHHEVITSSGGRDKWRIVFDCSAKQKGATSLNDHLIPGPNLNPDLVSLLLNFRSHPVALSTDISRAYMRIAITPEDQPLFRFIWQAPGSSSIKTYQMRRVTWGAASSGFLLAATVRHHLKKGNLATQELSKCLYADDVLQSFENIDRARLFVDTVRESLKSAGMSLAKWKTNSDQLRNHLLSTGVRPDEFDSSSSEFLKVLGISWCPSQDVFSFITPALFDGPGPESSPSKRQVLSVVASLYDPLGWLTPFTLRGKRIIQQLWSSNLNWNDATPEVIRIALGQWMSEIKQLRDFRFPRRYSCRKDAPIAHWLHVFGDASTIAYAAGAYIESRFADGSSEFALVMTKSRLAPRDSPSLPRLELLASVIAVRLKKFLTQRLDLEFERVLFYTDSTIAYHWATSSNPGSWKLFVSNRVQEIQRDSRQEDWFHLSGELNIIDFATRGVSVGALIENSEWWFGPKWLRLPIEQRPLSQPQRSSISLESVSPERRQVVALATAAETFIDLERFGTASKATRVVAYVLRFIHIVREKEVPARKLLYREAECILIGQTQRQFLREEIECTRAGERVPSASKLAAFQLFIDDRDLLRIRTRLGPAPHLTYDEKCPIVVPHQSRLAKLLIVDAHRVNAHFGVNTVLNQLRRRFWIIRARQIIKSILRQCVVCRRRQGAPASQVEAPLPESRSTLLAPFSVAGVDFCGPFYTRLRADTFKTYVALFTCTVTRALHLETVPCMSAPQTHLALRRFLATYPNCQGFISDNGSSFAKCSTDIKRVFNTAKRADVTEFLRGREIEWTFNCARCPWRGGVFERMVGVLKSALAKTLGRNLIGYEEFRTVLCELTATINDRPITHVASESDVPIALTPAHFVRCVPHVPAIAPMIPIDSLGGGEVASGDDLRKAHAVRTNFFRSISVRWHREYLLLLRSSIATRGHQASPIRLGDVCLLRDDNQPRIRWRLVRILEAHPGRDGKTRTYTVMFENRRQSRRAAQLLIPLELSIEDEDATDAPTSD
ncbi:uncharacterized protein LOC114828172 [Galendromus occidentalis]|uniref:Uncharacterized protein LOC114828172 n=1 Tax=Galendromus occidentalis TaxID=34638 RepID=A0AAJ7SE74_9ACAR|nr:uncharacterized protein LOC114828172 [Galendromus occidentalis]